MKKIYFSLLVVFGLVLLSFNVYALSIMPGDQIDQGPKAAIDPHTSNNALTDYLYNQWGLENPLYKSNVGGAEEGPLMGSYETEYFNTPSDPSEATITYVGGMIIDAPAYLVVKDGNTDPYWYLFNLTSLGWNGTETLYLTGFWPNQGAISHVEFYGGTSTKVPEPSTLLLFGAGIAGLAMYRRKRS